MASVTVKTDFGPGWKRAIYKTQEVADAVTEEAERIAARANSMSAGFRTGIFHDHATGETRGNTQPRYEAKPAQMREGKPIGIVVTANYAAQKDTLENNTLLKAR